MPNLQEALISHPTLKTQQSTQLSAIFTTPANASNPGTTVADLAFGGTMHKFIVPAELQTHDGQVDLNKLKAKLNNINDKYGTEANKAIDAVVLILTSVLTASAAAPVPAPAPAPAPVAAPAQAPSPAPAPTSATVDMVPSEDTSATADQSDALVANPKPQAGAGGSTTKQASDGSSTPSSTLPIPGGADASPPPARSGNLKPDATATTPPASVDIKIPALNITSASPLTIPALQEAITLGYLKPADVKQKTDKPSGILHHLHFNTIYSALGFSNNTLETGDRANIKIAAHYLADHGLKTDAVKNVMGRLKINQPQLFDNMSSPQKPASASLRK